jgi:hypothetical protein
VSALVLFAYVFAGMDLSGCSFVLEQAIGICRFSLVRE